MASVIEKLHERLSQVESVARGFWMCVRAGLFSIYHMYALFFFVSMLGHRRRDFAMRSDQFQMIRIVSEEMGL